MWGWTELTERGIAAVAHADGDATVPRATEKNVATGCQIRSASQLTLELRAASCLLLFPSHQRPPLSPEAKKPRMRVGFWGFVFFSWGLSWGLGLGAGAVLMGLGV